MAGSDWIKWSMRLEGDVQGAAQMLTMGSALISSSCHKGLRWLSFVFLWMGEKCSLFWEQPILRMKEKKKKEKRVLMFIQTNAFYCLYLLSSPILRIIRAYLYEEQNHLSNANYLDYLMTISVIFKASNSVRASCRSEVVKVCTRGSSLGS